MIIGATKLTISPHFQLSILMGKPVSKSASIRASKLVNRLRSISGAIFATLFCSMPLALFCAGPVLADDVRSDDPKDFWSALQQDNKDFDARRRLRRMREAWRTLPKKNGQEKAIKKGSIAAAANYFRVSTMISIKIKMRTKIKIRPTKMPSF